MWSYVCWSCCWDTSNKSCYSLWCSRKCTEREEGKIWKFIEEEVNQAEINGHGLIVQMDGNLHAGPELIKDDPNTQNKNEEESLCNCSQYSIYICEGLVTRKRKLTSKVAEAVLDFFLVNEKNCPFLKKMILHEKREYGLQNFS